VRHGEDNGEDEAGEAELEAEVRQSSGELLALCAVVLPALVGEGPGGGLRQGGLQLEATLAPLTLERMFV
jgi:hypothetical protein